MGPKSQKRPFLGTFLLGKMAYLAIKRIQKGSKSDLCKKKKPGYNLTALATPHSQKQTPAWDETLGMAGVTFHQFHG